MHTKARAGNSLFSEFSDSSENMFWPELEREIRKSDNSKAARALYEDFREHAPRVVEILSNVSPHTFAKELGQLLKGRDLVWWQQRPEVVDAMCEFYGIDQSSIPVELRSARALVRMAELGGDAAFDLRGGPPCKWFRFRKKRAQKGTKDPQWLTPFQDRLVEPGSGRRWFVLPPGWGATTLQRWEAVKYGATIETVTGQFDADRVGQFLVRDDGMTFPPLKVMSQTDVAVLSPYEPPGGLEDWAVYHAEASDNPWERWATWLQRKVSPGRQFTLEAEQLESAFENVDIEELGVREVLAVARTILEGSEPSGADVRNLQWWRERYPGVTDDEWQVSVETARRIVASRLLRADVPWMRGEVHGDDDAAPESSDPVGLVRRVRGDTILRHGPVARALSTERLAELCRVRPKEWARIALFKDRRAFAAFALEALDLAELKAMVEQLARDLSLLHVREACRLLLIELARRDELYDGLQEIALEAHEWNSADDRKSGAWLAVTWKLSAELEAPVDIESDERLWSRHFHGWVGAGSKRGYVPEQISDAAFTMLLRTAVDFRFEHVDLEEWTRDLWTLEKFIRDEGDLNEFAKVMHRWSSRAAVRETVVTLLGEERMRGLWLRVYSSSANRHVTHLRGSWMNEPVRATFVEPMTDDELGDVHWALAPVAPEACRPVFRRLFKVDHGRAFSFWVRHRREIGSLKGMVDRADFPTKRLDTLWAQEPELAERWTIESVRREPPERCGAWVEKAGLRAGPGVLIRVADAVEQHAPELRPRLRRGVRRLMQRTRAFDRNFEHW